MSDIRDNLRTGNLTIRIEINCAGDSFIADPMGEILRIAERGAFDCIHNAQHSAQDTESVLFDMNGNRAGFARNSWGGKS